MKNTKQFLSVAIVVAILFSAIIFGSCTKNSDVTPDLCSGVTCQNGGTCSSGYCSCPTGYTGTYCETAVVEKGKVNFVNASSDQYNCYVNGVFFVTLNGGGNSLYAVSAGTYTCRFIQQTGIIFSAKDESIPITVTNGSYTTINFPW